MSLVLMLLFLSGLIIAHELGHLWVARRCGVKVERFGLGLPIGPAIFKKRFKGIDLCIHPVLFGGYVAFPDDSEDSDVPEDSPERFENQPILNRAAIAIAGITVNAIIAVVLMTSVLMIWGAPIYSVRAGGFVPQLEQLSQQQSQSAQQALQGLKQSAGVVMEPGSRVFTGLQSQVGAMQLAKPLAGWQPEVSATFVPATQQQAVKLTPPPAVMAGMLPGDALLTIDGDLVAAHHDRSVLMVMESIGSSANEPLALTIQPDAEQAPLKNLIVTPDENGKIGIILMPEEIGREPQNLFQAFANGNQFLWGAIQDNFKGLGKLFLGQQDLRQLSGPIGIVSQGAAVIEYSGLQNGLVLVAVISMILAVMNLLPIPLLDGGHLLFLAIEAVKGSPLSKPKQEALMQLGFFGLMGLMVFVVFNDIYNLVGRHFF